MEVEFQKSEIAEERKSEITEEQKTEEQKVAEEIHSKAELKRIEAEKRIKRIHELFDLIEKDQEELKKFQNELESHQNELTELVKAQIAAGQVRQKRDRKAKDVDEECGNNSEKDAKEGKERRERERKERREKEEKKEEVVEKKPPGAFSKFFFTPPPPPPPPVEPVFAPSSATPSPIKRRARAVSYDEMDKKTRLENFEIADIFQLKNIDVDLVRECLEKCDVTGDIKLFRRIFTTGIPKDKQLLRYLGGKNYQTKRNGLWIDDLNASYMKHVIKKIFEQSYTIVNDLEHYGENIDRFLMNQEHINSFNDDKYIEKLMGQITNIIDIKVGDK